VREIRFTFATAATTDSSTSMPANARVVHASTEFTTPYPGAVTVAVGIPGNTSLLQSVNQNRPQTFATGPRFVVNQDTSIGGSAQPVRVTITGSPGFGAGVCVVRYVEPDA
jgi:hypothetical protein